MPSATTRNLRVEVPGLNKLVRDLRALEVSFVADIKALNLRAAELVAVLAKREAPVGDAGEGDQHPGLLRDTIRAGATARAGFVKAGSSKAVYAGVRHFGWEARNIAPDKFLYRGLEAGRLEVERMYAVGVDEIVEHAISFEGGE